MAAIGQSVTRPGGGSGGSPRHVRRGTPEYPSRLEHLERPPPELWLRGPLDVPASRVVAIVGTRASTEYGRRMAHDLALGMSAAGWTVVSGLARGVDAAAHRGALAERGRTIGVLGCGIDRVYPAGHRDLYASVGRSGLLLSEFEPNTPPLRYNFPRRNRIIAALADAVVVVQAPERSGALITADMALDMGREVFAVPGPADQAVSGGVHRLIREGAGLATSANAVLEELGDSVAGPGEGSSVQVSDPRSAAEERLRAALRDGPALLDDLAGRTGMQVPAVLSMLSRLELAGSVRSLPGHRFELSRS